MNELFEDEKTRISLENEDPVDTAIPPDDIIAFNEQRSCADLYRLVERKQLDIAPDFQRGFIWSTTAQTLFIDSLMKQLPIPSMCISLDGKTQKRYVIDGLQRISTIVRFFREDSWILAKSADVDPRISGRKISEIKENEPMLWEKLENLMIPVTVLRCDYQKKNHMEYLFQIFHRLNAGGNKLFNQEIRNCIFQGTLNSLLKRMARTAEWMKFTETDESKIIKARFSHEERILRFFAFYFNQKQYSGRLSVFLNDFMENKRNLPEKEIQLYAELLQQTIEIANKMTYSIEIRNNRNLLEGILLGIAHNREHLSAFSVSDLQKRLQDLLQTKPYSEDTREGLAHTEKVNERINTAVRIFGA